MGLRSKQRYCKSPLVQKDLSASHFRYSGQDIHTLFTVLVSLDLCHEVECSTGVNFVIPTVVERQTPSQESLSWQTEESSNWQHVGYRLLCENRNTASLTSSVFPRFQIRFRNELMKRDEINDRTTFVNVISVNLIRMVILSSLNTMV
ncbi:hypothetical protein R1sor_006151 [Riccia sorocarpa]|uniref:Uncharacterized protein n=1 Tax=Riccia sorocarpa TaxID=122646 RepID=A0ABD3HQF4_9MARC